mgnify:FL=1
METCISNYLGNKYTVVSVGRVMTCVLGMVVRREREIREFVKTPFYRVIESVNVDGHTFTGEWRAVKGSAYFESPKLYKENGFKEKEEAKKLIAVLKEGTSPLTCRIVSIEKKKEKKNPHFCLTLQNFRTNAPNGSRSVRMKRSALCRSFTRRSLSPIREQTPECFRRQYQRRSQRT